MQKHKIRLLAAGAGIAMALFIGGCGTKAAVSDAPHFTKQVYVNYEKKDEAPSRDYFYIFESETEGYTADGAMHGIGIAFSCEQKEDEVVFLFGGSEEEPSVLKVQSQKDGVITGEFDNDGRIQVFEPLTGVDPATFDAEGYVKDR